MMSRPYLIIIGLIGLSLLGCTAETAGHNPAQMIQPDRSAATVHGTSSAPVSPLSTQPLAYLNNQAISLGDLRAGLLETSGGQILAELLIDRGVAGLLHQRGLKLTEADIQQEKELLLQALAPDAQQAQRLLQELQAVRGLGETRLASLLRRNAGLRMLVRDQVQVTQPALRQEYELIYGPKYEARIIVVRDLKQAGELLAKTRTPAPGIATAPGIAPAPGNATGRAPEAHGVTPWASPEIASPPRNVSAGTSGGGGASFTDLAIQYSTDSSKAQGGLLPPISPADASFPQVVRTTLAQLQPGAISDVVTLEGGYALLKLERKIDGSNIRFDDVKESLAVGVRRRAQRLLMQQQVKDILTQAQLSITDPALAKSFAEHRKLLMQ